MSWARRRYKPLAFQARKVSESEIFVSMNTPTLHERNRKREHPSLGTDKGRTARPRAASVLIDKSDRTCTDYTMRPVKFHPWITRGTRDSRLSLYSDLHRQESPSFTWRTLSPFSPILQCTEEGVRRVTAKKNQTFECGRHNFNHFKDATDLGSKITCRHY